MSKIDAQRAMREAKYARINASGPSRREAAAAKAAAAGEAPAAAGSTPASTETAGAPVSPPRTKPARTPKKAPATDAAPAPEGELCGHKSMNGRACTREAGHSEKSHRYG